MVSVGGRRRPNGRVVCIPDLQSHAVNTVKIISETTYVVDFFHVATDLLNAFEGWVATADFRLAVVLLDERADSCEVIKNKKKSANECYGEPDS